MDADDILVFDSDDCDDIICDFIDEDYQCLTDGEEEEELLLYEADEFVLEKNYSWVCCCSPQQPPPTVPQVKTLLNRSKT